jgi:hypothetical protein
VNVVCDVFDGEILQIRYCRRISALGGRHSDRKRRLGWGRCEIALESIVLRHTTVVDPRQEETGWYLNEDRTKMERISSSYTGWLRCTLAAIKTTKASSEVGRVWRRLAR